MPLGTLDRTPPPFFRQPSALTKLALCSALALLLMVGDARFQLMSPVRSAFAIVLHPLQRLMPTPVDAWESLAGRGRGAEAAMAAEDKTCASSLSRPSARAACSSLQAENERLRRLLELRPATSVPSQTAEVLFEAPRPGSRVAS